MKNNETFTISSKIVALMKNDNPQLNTIHNDDIEHMVSMLIVDYLATIGRGLARSKNKNEYVIVQNNILNPELSPGLFFRIPITLENRHKFIDLLITDLENYTQVNKSIGLYSVLEKNKNGIVLKNIQKVEKKTNTTYNKATVFVPE